MGKFGRYWDSKATLVKKSGGRRHLLELPRGSSSASAEPGVYSLPHSSRRALMGDDRAKKVQLAVSNDVLDEITEGAKTSDFFEEFEEGPPISWANTPIKDWRDCCDDSSDEFYMLLRAIFGYSSVPTRLEVVTYCGYWLAMLLILIYKLKKGTLYGKILKKHLDEKKDAALDAAEPPVAIKAAAAEEEEDPKVVSVEDASDGSVHSVHSKDDSATSIELNRAQSGAAEKRAAAVEKAAAAMEKPAWDSPVSEPMVPAPLGRAARLRSAGLTALERLCDALADQQTQRYLVEGAVWLSIAGCVIALLCASLMPGLDLSTLEWEDGLPGSAPFPKLGVTRKFTLVVTEADVDQGNGRGMKRMILVNGTSPGPELRVQHGNWVEVRVINNMTDRGTTMHWHGIVHRSSTFADGVIGFTQCVIPKQGEEYNTVIYRFEAYHAGTYWYHGHLEGQYVDGMYGPLIVEGIPEQHGGLYNAEWTWMAADYYKEQAEDILLRDFLTTANPDGFEPMPDAITVNGKFSREVRYHARRNDKIRVRFVNSAAWSPWNVSVDGLELKIIELDGQDVEPIVAPWIIVNVAQRVSFVIDLADLHGAKLKQSDQLYFRVEALNDTYPLGFEGLYANQGPKKLDPLFLGVIDFTAPPVDGRPATALPTYAVGDVPSLEDEYEPLPPDQMNALNFPEADVEKPTHRMIIALTMSDRTGINLGYLNNITHNHSTSVNKTAPSLFQMVKFEEEYKGRPELNTVWKDDDKCVVWPPSPFPRESARFPRLLCTSEDRQ